MKKILLFILLFVNLQVAIKGHDFVFVAGNVAMAQRMMSDIDYYCNDEDVGWYRSPIPCNGVDVVAMLMAPDGTGISGGGIASGSQDGPHGGSLSGGGLGGGSSNNTSNKDDAKEMKDCDYIKEDTVRKISCPGDPPNWSPDSPDCFEGAVMSELSYKDKMTFNDCLDYLTKHGWQIADDEAKKMGLVLHDEITGLDCTLMKKKNGKGYALVFAGTQPNKMSINSSNLSLVINPYTSVMDKVFGLLSVSPDIKTDIYQYLYGMDAQYVQAACNALTLAKSLNGVQITFVGHSLGGGEAAMASIVTKCPALTYNPAALSNETMKQLKKMGFGNDTSHIYRYIMEGDPVTNSQGIESQGSKNKVTNFTDGPAHDCKTMIDNISCEKFIDWSEEK